MSWRDVFELLESVGGRIEIIDPAALDNAVSKGPGDRETQIRIAEHYYNNTKRKESEHGQEKWEFA